MAIINTSPDSFAGDGVAVANKELLKAHMQKALDDGADMLDIGGQSTRPGAEIISEDEELARVLPAIELARGMTDKPISIDTFKPYVAEAALQAGATIINDIQGGQDPKMVALAAMYDTPIIIMHSRGTPQTMSTLTDYPAGVVEEVKKFFIERTKELIAAGVQAENITIDPGIGFAKTAAQSYELTLRLHELTRLGFPLLYGASNKSFIGKALADDGQPAPVEERAAGTVVVQAQAMLNGAAIIRVHDVKAAVQTRAVVEALTAERKI